MGDGETLLGVAEADTESLVLRNLVLNETKTAATRRPEALGEIFYGDCSDEDVAWAAARLVPQASAPLGTPVHVSRSRWGAIPSTYVHCTNDRAITLACQKQMVARTGAGTVTTLDASHSPFLSMPRELVQVLLAAAG